METRIQKADAWLTEQFLTLGKRTATFHETRNRVEDTERIVRAWFKRNGLTIYFKKEPKRGKGFNLTITNAYKKKH